MTQSASAAARARKAPQDHKPPSTDMAVLHFRDASFEVPLNIDDIDGEFLMYAADGDAYRMAHMILSPADSRKFKAMKPTIGDYKDLSEQISQVYGFETAGN